MSNSASGFRSRKVGCDATRMLRANSGIAGVRYMLLLMSLQPLIYDPPLAKKAGQVKIQCLLLWRRAVGDAQSGEE